MIYRHAKTNKPFREPDSWQQLPNGEAYCNAFRSHFAPWLPKILGYQILKLGNLSSLVPTDLPLRHQIMISETPQNLTALLTPNDSLIQGALTELPLIEKSIHACFLTQTLNFAQDPHQILRETHRVLADDGWLFIAIFNPLNPLMWRLKAGDFPIRLYSARRIMDWLSLLNFDVIDAKPLTIHAKNATIFSPIQAITAQKRTYPLTLNPEKARLKMPAFLEPAGAFKTKS